MPNRSWPSPRVGSGVWGFGYSPRSFAFILLLLFSISFFVLSSVYHFVYIALYICKMLSKELGPFVDMSAVRTRGLTKFYAHGGET